VKMTGKPIPDIDPPMCALIREATPQGDILHVLGEIDIANADELEAALQQLAIDFENVVVDFSGCTFIDSSGLRALAVVRKSIDSRMRIVIPPDGSVSRIFDITGLHSQFGTYQTLGDALATLPASAKVRPPAE